MLPNSFGDMTRQLVLGRQSASLKSNITAMSYEMTTGHVYDKASALDGRLGLLAGLEKAFNRADVVKIGAQTVLSFLERQQAAVNALLSFSETALSTVVPTTQNGDANALNREVARATEYFSSVIGLLNANYVGRNLFAGDAGGAPAVAEAAQILDSLALDLPMPADLATLSDFIDDWFAPGGGFDTAGYLGSTGTPNPIPLGQGVVVRNDVTAQDPALRQILATFAKGALFERVAPDATVEEKRHILESTRSGLLKSTSALIDLAARIGSEEEKALTAKTRAEAEQTALSISRSELLSSDPYETASKLENAITLLDTIYALTARLSRLSLMNYLR